MTRTPGGSPSGFCVTGHKGTGNEGMSMTKSTEQLRKELKEAEARERAQAEEARRAVKVQWKFTLMPDTRGHDVMYDETCLLYSLKGEITNREEAEAVGHHLSHSEGSMTYVFNTVTGRIVCATGGGTIYVGGFGGAWSGGEQEQELASQTMRELGTFLTMWPEGGDVTAIVANYREHRGLS